MRLRSTAVPFGNPVTKTVKKKLSPIEIGSAMHKALSVVQARVSVVPYTYSASTTSAATLDGSNPWPTNW